MVELPFLDGGEIFRAVPDHPGSITLPTTQEANGERELIDKKISCETMSSNSLFLFLSSYFLFCPRLERLTDDNFQKAEDFVKIMKLLYTSILCVSSEKSPTCGQILLILTKLEAHFTVTVYNSALKEKVWGDLEYQVFSIFIRSLCLKRKKANHIILLLGTK